MYDDGGIIINIFIEFLKIIIAALIILILYKDTNRIFKIFFRNPEKKFLIIQVIKLGIFLLIVFKLGRYIPYLQVILLFIILLVFIFIALLTVRQVTLSYMNSKDFKTIKYKTFRYDNRFSEYALRIFALIMNIGEIAKNRNALKKKSIEMMYIALFPVQKYIAVSITGVELTHRREKFISKEQLEEIHSELKPGDILLKRNDWQATNFGISGFWTHSGLYIGSLEEMDAYFGEMKCLKGKKFSDQIKEINSEIYQQLLKDKSLTVVEAIIEGVVFKPLSNIAKVDYFAALRPRMAKEKKLNAILKAIKFIGTPYDYNFNLETDDAFVCTELIKKSYEEEITFSVSSRFGRKMIYPNSIARKYFQERKRKYREFDFVLFYDLDIKQKKARKSTEKEFAKSFRRNITFYKNRDMLRYLSTIISK